MQVFRLHIRPQGGLADHAYSFAYCLQEEILGVGWPVDSSFGTVETREQYKELALKKYDKKSLQSVRVLQDQVQPNHLIWTRDTDGKYYLAQVQKSWEYLDTETGRNADIVNVVRCKICPLRLVDDVPGKIVANFIRGPAIRRLKDTSAVSYSQLLWNQLVKREEYALQTSDSNNLFAYLDWEATEDVIFIYLQTKNWLIMPHSRKRTTMSYEFMAINRTTSERAVVQVKTGNTPLNRDELKGFADRVFLFQANGIYHGSAVPSVCCLMPEEIENFIRTNIAIMPGVVQKWVKYLNERYRR